MRKKEPITEWIGALTISSVVVAVYLVTAGIILGSRVWETSEFSFTLQAAISLIVLVLLVSLIVLVLSFIPALIISGAWELSGRSPSTILYAAGGTATGLALVLLYVPNYTSDVEGKFLSRIPPEDWWVFLIAASAGFLGGFMMAWRRKIDRRLNSKIELTRK